MSEARGSQLRGTALFRRLCAIAALYLIPVGIFVFLNLRASALGPYSYWTTAREQLTIHLGTPTGMVRAIAALTHTFGAVLLVVVADSKAALRLLSTEPEWGAFGICCLALFLTGGTNLESFASYGWSLVAVLFAATMRGRPDFWFKATVLLSIAVFHLGVGGVLREWGTGPAYFEQFPYFSSFETAVSTLLIYALGAAMLRVWCRLRAPVDG